MEVANLVARLGFVVDETGAHKYDQQLTKARTEAKRGVTAPLGFDERDQAVLNAYNRKLKETQATVARRDKFRAHLGAELDSKSFNAANRQIARTTKAMDEQVHATGRIRTKFGTLFSRGAEGAAAIVGFYGLEKGVESVTEAYKEHQLAEAQLRTQLKATGEATKANTESIDSVVKKQSELSGIAVPKVIAGYTQLQRATGNVSKSTSLLGVAVDLARAKHMDLERAGLLVGKVAQGNTSVLTRYGIILKPVTAAVDALKQKTNDQIASLEKQAATTTGKAHQAIVARIVALRNQATEEGKAAKATDKQSTAQQAIATLQKRFGGQAEAYGKTQQGAADKARAAWEEVRAKLGEKLAPVIQNILGKLTTFAQQMLDGSGAGGKFAKAAEHIGRAIAGIYKVIKDNQQLLKDAVALWVAYEGAVKGAAALSGLAGLKLAGGKLVGGAAAGTAAGGAATGVGAATGGAAAGGLGVKLLSGAGLKTLGAGLLRRVPAVAALLAAVDFVQQKGTVIDRSIGVLHNLSFGLFPKNPHGDRSSKQLEDFNKQVTNLVKAGDAPGLRRMQDYFKQWTSFDAPGGIKQARKELEGAVKAAQRFPRAMAGALTGGLRKQFKFFDAKDLTANFTAALDKLRPAVRAKAEGVMIDWAKAMEKGGRLPIGATARIVQNLAREFGPLSPAMRRAAHEGVKGIEAELRRRTLTQAAQRQQDDLKKTYQDFPKVAKTTSRNARLNFLVELDFLRTAAHSKNKALASQAAADFKAVSTAADKWGGQTKDNYTKQIAVLRQKAGHETGALKEQTERHLRAVEKSAADHGHGAATSLDQALKDMGIKGGRRANAARAAISRALQKMATSVGDSSRNAAGALADAARNIGKNANSILHGFGIGRVNFSVQTPAQHKFEGQLGVPDIGGAGGFATGGIPHPGSGSRDDHLLLDPRGRPVAAMSGTEGILNTPQMGIVNSALGFAKQFGGLAFGSLGDLWGSGMRHYAGGGVLQRMNQLEKMSLPYVWGGHHGDRGVITNPRPGLDCSSTVSYVLGIPPRVSGAFENYGQPGPGAISIFANPTHVFMRAFGKYFGTSNSNPGGGPGFIDPRSSAGFVTRHVDPSMVGGDITVRTPTITGPKGALLDAARGGARTMARAANRYIGRQMSKLDGSGQALNEGLPGGGGARALGHRMMLAAGFGENQWPPLNSLWTKESGWNPKARNASSGAAGIPQDITGNFHGGARGQIAWGLNYIKGRYGNPAGAWAHERAFNWYRGGGKLPHFSGGGRPLNQTVGGSGSTGGSPIRPVSAGIGRLRKTRGKQVAAYNAIEGDHGTLFYLHKDYDLAQRRFDGISDTDLIDANGAVNTKALATKAKWAKRMWEIDKSIRNQTVTARAIAQRVAQSYRTIANRLKQLVRYSRGPLRAKARSDLKGAQAGLSEWMTTAKDLGYDVTNAKLDVGEALASYQAVLGTKAQPDAGSGAGGGGGITPDQQAQLDQVTQLKQIVETGTFLNSAAQSVLGGVTGGGGNFNPSSVGEAGSGTTVNIHFNSLAPASPQQAQEVAGHVVRGLGYQGSVRSPRVNLGV